MVKTKKATVKAKKNQMKAEKKLFKPSSSRISPAIPCDFFKVYLSSFSSDILNIPRAVVTCFGRITRPKDVVLRDDGGRMTICSMGIENGRLAIADGWKKFVDSHSLEDGSFLTFIYDGDSRFDVKIFKANGLRRKEVEIESQTEEEDESETEAEDEAETEEEDESENDEEEEEENQTSYESESSMKQTSKYRGPGFSKSGRAKLKGSSPKIHEKKKASSSTDSFNPQNAHFWAVITAASEYALHVSKKATKPMDIKLKPFLTLHDENGMPWTVKVAFRKDGRIAFTKGWTDFFRRKNLKPQDECFFKFVGVLRNTCEDVQVRILRSGHS